MSKHKADKGYCAACVYYQNGTDEPSYQWIKSKIVSQKGNKYIVLDEEAEDKQKKKYTVESCRISPFPNVDQEYKIGEKVIALWFDDESGEWSTMFYLAKVVEPSSNGIVKLQYQETDSPREVDETKICKIPTDFDLADSSDQEEEEQVEAEEKKESETTEVKEETEDKVEVEVKEEAPPTPPPQKSPSPSPPPPPPASKTPQHSSQTNTEDETADVVTPPPEPRHPVQIEEQRRLHLFFNKPEQTERQPLKILDDEDFTNLAGPEKKIERMHTLPGTPLLNCLEDPELFTQERSTHMTGSGTLAIDRTIETNIESALLSGQVHCGRLGRILNEWRV